MCREVNEQVQRCSIQLRMPSCFTPPPRRRAVDDTNMQYRSAAKISAAWDCNLLVVTSANLVLCQVSLLRVSVAGCLCHGVSGPVARGRLRWLRLHGANCRGWVGLLQLQLRHSHRFTNGRGSAVSELLVTVLTRFAHAIKSRPRPQDKKLQLYDFEGAKQREWCLDAVIRYIKVRPGQDRADCAFLPAAPQLALRNAHM